MLLSSLLAFILSDSGGPPAVDIHDVPTVPNSAVFPDVNGVSAVVGLPACCCWLHYFCKHLCFCWHPYCVGGPVVAFIPDVACVHTIVVILACCWSHCYCLHHCCCLHPSISGIPIAGAPFFSDILTVAGLPAIAGMRGVVVVSVTAFVHTFASGPSVAGHIAVADILPVASILVEPSIPIFAGVFSYCTAVLYNESY
jgi:hypothetical protein